MNARKGWKKWVAVLLALGTAAVLGGCQPQEDDYSPYRENISELRNVCYAGESEHFEVEVYAGEREDPYRTDGIAEERKRFFLVMVFPKVNLERKEITVAFELDRNYRAQLLKNPAFDSYAYDFGAVEGWDGNFLLEVGCENFVEEVNLLRISAESEENWEQALRKGVDFFHEKEGWQQREAAGFEIALRLVRDSDTGGELCWHYMMVFPDGSVWGKLIPCADEA